MGVLFDYITTLSVFTAILVFDMRREEEGKGDCCNCFCGFCLCSPTGKFWCKGRFTPPAFKQLT